MEGNLGNERSQRSMAIRLLIQCTLQLALTFGYQLAFSFQHTSPTESLRPRSLSAADTTAVNLLNELAKQHWRVRPDSAQHYARQALDEARQIRYRKGEAEALRILGWSYNNQGNQDQAKAYLNQAIQIFEQIAFEPGLGAALNNLGVVNEYSGNYEEGLEAHLRALTIFRKLNNQEAVGSVLNYIGIVYQSLGDYEKAVEYCLQGLRIRQEIQDHPGIAYSLINMGNMYLATEQVHTALDYYLQSLDYAEDRALPSINYSRWQLGKAYTRLNQYDSATYFLRQSLDRNPNDYVALQILGEVHLEKGAHEVSLQYLLKSLSLLEQKNQRSQSFVQTLHLISRAYAAQKQFTEALSYA
ncbi:MAG TPA: tetratricopeptide repeat protein [Cyclobacteriaceae bacterium]|nr:tetratricopeptide repeat protein [Cyclobacteriaceae bacterium]